MERENVHTPQELAWQHERLAARRAREEAAREAYELTRTPAVLAGLAMVRRNGGTMARGADGEPSKIAALVAWAHLGGTAHVQEQFDRYAEASDWLAKVATGRAD